MFNLFFLFCLWFGLGKSCRPDVSSRAFQSQIIDGVVNNITSLLKDPMLSKIFNCSYPNTLDTTVQYNYSTNQSNIDTFIITGDIDAMWLRDSTWQVNGYLQFINKTNNNTNETDYKHLYNMLYGLHNRQLNSVLIDPYANSFNPNSTTNNTPHANDIRIPAMNPSIFEGKYELDSLICVLYYTYQLFELTNDISLLSNKYQKVVNIIYDVLKYQQQSTSNINNTDELYYFFQRQTKVPTDTLLHGIGPPGLYTGMIRSAFRPSDDATRLPFNIASNGFAVSILNKTSLLFKNILHNITMYNMLINLSIQINNGINEYGILIDKNGNKYFAYEVDGYGSYYFMDDGNVPSLLSLPYLGYIDINDPIYINTRNKLLSIQRNPYYFIGIYGEGVGSPHTTNNYIWPMAIIMRAMTSNNDTEIMQSLDILKTTTNDTYFMHESFNKDNPAQYSRSWFAWCNNLFGDLILKLVNEKPYLVI